VNESSFIGNSAGWMVICSLHFVFSESCDQQAGKYLTGDKLQLINIELHQLVGTKEAFQIRAETYKKTRRRINFTFFSSKRWM